MTKSSRTGEFYITKLTWTKNRSILETLVGEVGIYGGCGVGVICLYNLYKMLGIFLKWGKYGPKKMLTLHIPLWFDPRNGI